MPVLTPDEAEFLRVLTPGPLPLDVLLVALVTTRRDALERAHALISQGYLYPTRPDIPITHHRQQFDVTDYGYETLEQETT